ncbi:MAG: hypothetical protein JRJ02_06690 [Deltaproteobacteria bacterium]|nr:hypothetical protein [Deltaproteobacteria bacterium]
MKYLATKGAAETVYKLEKMGKEANLNHANETFKHLSKECERLKNFMVNYRG